MKNMTQKMNHTLFVLFCFIHFIYVCYANVYGQTRENIPDWIPAHDLSIPIQTSHSLFSNLDQIKDKYYTFFFIGNVTLKDPGPVSYEFSVELQFEFEWLKRAINCSKWAISSQVGMRSLKGSSRRNERRELHNRRTSHLTPTLKNFT